MISTFAKAQIISFFCALVVYACLGSPTPDNPGIPEFLIAIFLILAIRIDISRKSQSILFCAILGISIPLITSFVNGNNLIDIVRDIVPCLFLFLPLFYGWIARERGDQLPKIVAMIGIVFSIRTVWAYRDILFTPTLWGVGPPADLLYLANSPEVLFSALICIGPLILFGKNRRNVIHLGGLAIIALIPTIAMALMTQRAGLGAVVVVSFLWWAILIWNNPSKGLIIAICGGIACWTFYPLLEILWGTLWQKTELVGLNSRAQEWAAVMNKVTHSPVTLLFGEGWGGRIENPAVGGLNVNYTHSLLSALLLKTGLVGTMVIMIGAIFPLFRALKEGETGDKTLKLVLWGAVLPPVLIASFLYASYKSLGFGLMLLVFLTFSNRKLEKNPEAMP